MNGYQYLLNGTLLVRFSEGYHLPLPPVPEEYMGPGGTPPFDYEGILSSNTSGNGEVVELPNLVKLKTYIKAQKAAHKGQKNYTPEYDFGFGHANFNAQCLADAMELVPNATAKLYGYSLQLSNPYGNKVVLMVMRRIAGQAPQKTEI